MNIVDKMDAIIKISYILFSLVYFDFPNASINKNMVGNKIKPIVKPIPLLNFLASIVYKYVENRNCTMNAILKDKG